MKIENRPPISVVITFWREDDQFLRRCIQSVMWQLGPFDELILVYDGHEESLDLAAGLEFCRNYFAHARGFSTGGRKGVSAARNIGWRAAENEWVKFLDVDDLLAPFALNAFRQTIPRITESVSVIAGGWSVVHNGIQSADFRRVGLDQAVNFKQMNPFLVSFCLIRKSTLDAMGAFDERIDFEEDWDMWLKIHRWHGAAAFRCIPERICYYTIDDEIRAKKVRHNTIEGMNVREYFKKTYGCNPK